jgi:hypothetical protein
LGGTAKLAVLGGNLPPGRAPATRISAFENVATLQENRLGDSQPTGHSLPEACAD